MGCDIHPAIEYREDGEWKAVLCPNKYFGKYSDEPKITAKLDIDRDYDLFAVLGNVRNGRSAGCDMGDGFDPMTDCRGVPDDISDEAREVLSDEHSATWVTLAEILAYDWNRSTKHRGWVSAVEFLDWDWMKEYKSAPRTYSGGVGGGSIKHITAAEMKQRVDAIRNGRHGKDEQVIRDVDEQLGRHYCQIEWEETYTQSTIQMWTKILPKMLNLGRQYGFENVRLVMDFDS